MFQVVLELARKRAEVAALEKELELLVPDGESTSAPKASSRANVKGQHHRGSLSDRILEKMNDNPSHLHAAEDFLDISNGSNMQTLRSTLLRLRKSGFIERPRRGRFKLAKSAVRQPDLPSIPTT